MQGKPNERSVFTTASDLGGEPREALSKYETPQTLLTEQGDG